MRYGYHGKILLANLSTKQFDIENPEEEFYRKYGGGSALNLFYILKHMPVGADPLHEDNVLAMSLSVITGAPISGTSRMTVTAKSPLTGAIGDSQCGGSWPAKFKFAGFDGLIVIGKSLKPVYLWIDDGIVELRDASHLWGKTTGEVETVIQSELSDNKIEVLQIGPAGEKQVRFASILNQCSRANGRTGLGAVMGSKNLKAIAVRGKQKPKLADRASVINLARKGTKALPKSMVAKLGKYGTAGIVESQQEMGGLPSLNYSSGVFEGWQSLNGVTMYKTILAGREENKQDQQGRETCFGCVVRCKRKVDIDSGPNPVDPRFGGPEYETISLFGSSCGISNLNTVAKANEICNQYGMDTISCGGTIAWAIEAFQNDALTKDDTNGLELKFGDDQLVIQLIRMIAERKGLGNLLAEGSAAAAQKLGRGSEFLTTCKGLEAPAHMPQLKRSLALIYAVNACGADHESSEHDFAYDPQTFPAFSERLRALNLKDPQSAQDLGTEKVKFARITQYLYSLMDSLNLCMFVWGPAWQLFGPQDMVEMVSAVTGWDITIDELLEIGERRVNMMRLFNAREGITLDQDTLPDKFFKGLKDGPTDGWQLDRSQFEAARQEYYRQMGWETATGYPNAKTLNRLGISKMVEN